jgi:hypothetical protein
MAKTWVLDSETKGTGAHIEPLGAEGMREVERELELVRLGAARRTPSKEPAPREPLRFKVVDVLGARTLGEDVDAREAVRLLGDVRGVLDARVSVRSPGSGRWRVLGLEEQRALWRFRRQAG